MTPPFPAAYRAGMENDYASQSDYIAQCLVEDGRVRLTGPTGGVLWIIGAGLLGEDDRRGFLIAYEGKGAFFYEPENPLSKYTLVASGFPLPDANFVAALVNGVVECIRDHPSLTSPRM